MKLRSTYRRATRLLSGATGAVDLASIMVGVLVVGIVAGVITATVTTVIPWSQDQAARQSLSSVVTAESVARVKEPHGYMALPDLVAAKYIHDSKTVNAAVNAAGTCFIAVSVSSAGKVYWVSDQQIQPVEYKSGDTSGCADLASLVGTIASAPNAGGSGSAPVFTTAAWDPSVGYITDIAGSADGRILTGWGSYVSSAYRLFHSLDGGATWTVIRTSQYPGTVDTSADGLTIVALEGGAGDGLVDVSHDGGATWTYPYAHATSGLAWTDVAVSADGRTIYASEIGYWSSGFVDKSTDGGATWSYVWSSGSSFPFHVAVSADGKHVAVFTKTANSLQPNVFTSTDSGSTWNTGNPGLGFGANWRSGVVSADGTTIAGVADTGALTISTDLGTTWTTPAATPANLAGGLSMSANGKRIYITAGNSAEEAWLSTDTGTTFTQLDVHQNYLQSAFLSTDGRKMIIPVNGNTLILGTF